MKNYYDRNGEIILEFMQDFYYKMGLMCDVSKEDYEIYVRKLGNTKSESKLNNILIKDFKSKLTKI